MSTKRFAVIGQPVRHSLSPVLFKYLFAQSGVDATYVAHEVAPASLVTCIAAMRAGEWDGLSVTVPHKLAVRALADVEGALVRKIGAANTLARTGERIVAYNTDAEGCRRALAHAGVELKGARVVILGAGGAARSAVFAALESGAASVVITNRTLSRAEELAQSAADARCTALAMSPERLQQALVQADVLIQSTTVGMSDPQASPLPADVRLPKGLAVLDMVYRPLETALLREAARQGCRAVDGLWMLIFQALKQFELWTGIQTPDSTAIALHAHLRGAAT